MSKATAARDAEDEAIQLAADTSLGKYYRLGKQITVRVSGNHFLCLTCCKVNACAHSRRIEEYLRDNPA